MVTGVPKRENVNVAVVFEGPSGNTAVGALGNVPLVDAVQRACSRRPWLSTHTVVGPSVSKPTAFDDRPHSGALVTR